MTRLLSSIHVPVIVTLYRELHLHRQGLEQRFDVLTEYSYSPENVRKTRAFDHSLNYVLIIFIAFFPGISWESAIFDYIHSDISPDFLENIDISQDFLCA